MSLLNKASIVTTPTAYENGKILSVKPSIVLGDELVVNGDFATDSYWTKSGGATISGGQANIVGDGTSFTNIIQHSIFTIGKKYKVSVDVTISSGLGLKFQDGANNENIGFATTSGTYVFYFTGTSNANFVIGRRTGGTAFNSSVNNVSVKEALDADFQFTRNSSATRVNSQGLIEDMQILSGDLVSNGDFSQESSELITNGDFSSDSDWTKGIGWSIGDGVANVDNTSANYISQDGIVSGGKNYEITFTISNFVQGSIRLRLGNTYGNYVSGDGTYTQYIQCTTSNKFRVYSSPSGANLSIDNVSVKEVGQDWTFGGGWSMGNGVAESDSTPASYLGQEGVILTTNPYELTFQARLKSGTNGTVTALIGGSNSNQFTIEDTNWQIFKYKNTRLPSTQTGIYFNNDGNEIEITNVSVVEITEDTNLPRIDYTGGEGHWLFEPQSTNLLPYSSDFSNWSIVNATTLSNQSISPDGTLNADKLTPNNTAASIFIYNQVTLSASNYTLSFFVKYDGRQYVQLLFGSNVSLDYSNFDLVNQTVTYGNGNIEYYGNDWYRISLTANVNSGTTEVYLWSIDSALSSRASSSTGNGVNGYYIYGAQLEQNSFNTSYIPTNGEVNGVTRLADAAFGAGSSDLINSTEGTLYAEIARDSNGAATGGIQINDGSAGNSIRMFFNQTNTISVITAVGNSNNVVKTAQSITSSTDINKFALHYKLNDYKMYYNGSELWSDTINALVWQVGTFNNIDFKNQNTPFNGKVRCLAVFKEALNNDELECLTGEGYESFNALALANNYTII
jgi:hypothetical protein